MRVLSAESVRGLRVPYLFLAGLGERSFPSPQREDRLYSEAEYQRLIDAGLPLAAAGPAQRRRDAVVLRGRHPRDAAAYFELPGLGPAGPAAVAEPLPRRGPTGVRPGADRADGAEPTEPGAGGRGAFFGGRVPRQGGGHGPGGGRVAVGGLLQGRRREAEGGSKRKTCWVPMGTVQQFREATSGQSQQWKHPRGPETGPAAAGSPAIWSGGRDAHRCGGAAAVGGRFLAAANLSAPRNSNSTPPAPSAISSPRCWAWTRSRRCGWRWISSSAGGGRTT